MRRVTLGATVIRLIISTLTACDQPSAQTTARSLISSVSYIGLALSHLLNCCSNLIPAFLVRLFQKCALYDQTFFFSTQKHLINLKISQKTVAADEYFLYELLPFKTGDACMDSFAGLDDFFVQVSPALISSNSLTTIDLWFHTHIDPRLLCSECDRVLI
jgi:hypothetical protein